MANKTIINPTVPYVGPLPSPIEPGKLVRILGSTLLTTKTFTCNIQCGSNTFDDIVISVTVRLFEQNILIRSLLHGIWQTEKTIENSSITQGQQFEVLIICEPTIFKIGISGKHLCEYPFPPAFRKASHIKIDGEVSISLISVEGTQLPQQIIPINNTMSYPPPYSQQGTAPPQQGEPGYPLPNQSAYPPSNHPGYPPSNQPGYPPSNQPGYPPQSGYPGYPTNPNSYPPTQAPGVYVHDPLINPTGNIAAANATPRSYQPQFWSRPFGGRFGGRYGSPGERRVAYIALGIFSVIFVSIFITILVVFIRTSSRF